MNTENMDELQPRRLTRKSEALLEEYQIIDMAYDAVKSVENFESVTNLKRRSSTKVMSQTNLASRTSLKQADSQKKLKQDSLHDKSISKSGEKLGLSSSTGILKTRIRESKSQELATKTSEHEAKTVKSNEDTLLKVKDLNKSVENVEQKKSEVHFIEEKEEEPSVSTESDACPGICREKTCLDSGFRLPPIRRTSSQNATWDIRGLGVPPAAREKQTFSIQRVNHRRKERHEYIIREIDYRMHDLNEVIEQEIRAQAESLVSNIHMIKDNVEHILLTIKEKQDANLNKKLVIRMQEIIKQLNDSRLNKIDTFCDFARKLERHRSERFKLILKNAYKEMHDNMYLMPYEIQKFFENKVQHLNEITMNNYHIYTELEGKLKLQMEEETRQWFQALKCSEVMRRTTEQAMLSFDISDVFPEEQSIGPSKEEIKLKLNKAEEDFLRLKSVAKKLNYLKSHPVMEVFENYLDEMRNAAFALFQSGLIDHKGMCLDEEAILRLSHMNCINLEELQKLWQDAIQSMLNTLDNNLKSFTSSTHIFDAYFDRLQETRNLYNQQLFVLIAKNDKQTMQMNTTMNLLIDTLRQDANEDCLNKSLQQIQTTIQNIETLIHGHSKDEIALVDKFYQFAMTNVDIWMDELARFVKQFVPPPDADPRVMRKRASWMNVDELKTNDHLFSRDFLNCRFLMQSIDNWQFGVWHSLVTTIDTSKPVIAAILTKWADNEKQKLVLRGEMKVTMNSVRIHNITLDFWKVRLAELKLHEDRFLQHDLAVRQKLTQMVHLKRQMQETCTNFLKGEFNDKINEIMSGYQSITKERHVNSIINKLRRFNLSAAQDIRYRLDCLKDQYFRIMVDVRDSHLKFMRSMRLFSENGNFAVDEAKMLMKKLVTLEKLIGKEFSNSRQYIERIYDDFSYVCQEKLEVPLETLHKALEEFTFKDEVDRRLRKLHREIGETVLDLDSDMRQLNEKIRNCSTVSYSDVNLGNYDYIFAFSRSFKDILADIDTMAQKYHYDDGLAPNEKTLKQRADTSQVSLTPTIASKMKKSAETKVKIDDAIATAKKFDIRKRSLRAAASIMKTKTHATILYPHAPAQEDESFHAKLHLKMYTSYCELQDVAKFFNLSREQLKKKSSEVMSILGEDLKAIEDNYTSIHKKLKPMFGHPDNSRMLAIVESYMDQAVEFNKRKLLDDLPPKEEIIKHHCVKTETFFLDMEKILSCIKDSTTIQTIRRELYEKLSERIGLMKKILSLDFDPELDELADVDFIIDFQRKINFFRKRIEIPKEYILPYPNILQRTCTLTSPPLLVVEDFISSNHREYERIIEKIENLRNTCSDLHNKYKIIWDQDIDRIKNLYKIKYGNINPEWKI